MTYREAWTWGTSVLLEKGIVEAKLDAWYLLEQVSGKKKAGYFLAQDEEMPDEERYQSLILQRARRIPLQHLLGFAEFMGLPFRVNEHVLIPRADTEKLVELVLADEAWLGLREEAARSNQSFRALDMCTGSGCIAVSLAKEMDWDEVVAADISADALAVARENARINQVENLLLIESDLFSELAGEKFNLITANPPYIPSGEIEGLMPEVRDHDPRLALDGREDGLYFYRRLAGESGEHLQAGGKIYWEIGYNQGEAVKELLKQAGFTHVAVMPDDTGHDRVITGEWTCLTN